MATSSVKVSSKNKISLPKPVRKQLMIKPGDRLLLDIQGGMMILLPVHGTFTQALARLDGTIWENSQEYIGRERSAWIDSTETKR